MQLDYTPETYNKVVNAKKAVEEYLVELYQAYETTLPSDRLDILHMVDAFKEILSELTKYVILYQKLVDDKKASSKYTIIEGDTLPAISHKVTGSHTNWHKIYIHNQLKDLTLVPGDVLEIPEGI